MTLATLEKKLSKIKLPGKRNAVYTLLVERFPPRELKSRQEHAAYLELVETLMAELRQDPDARTQEGMRRYLAVLAPLISKYEAKQWPAKRPTDREVLAFLMEQNGLTQKDLKAEIGAQPYVSDILRGKKQLTKGQVQRLSKRFGVSPAVFFPEQCFPAVEGEMADLTLFLLSAGTIYPTPS